MPRQLSSRAESPVWCEVLRTSVRRGAKALGKLTRPPAQRDAQGEQYARVFALVSFYRLGGDLYFMSQRLGRKNRRPRKRPKRPPELPTAATDSTPQAPAGIGNRAARTGLTGRIASVLVNDGFVYALLLLLVWGLTAPLRGLWQDDTALLAIALGQQGMGLSWLRPLDGPLRRLYTLPFHAALLTPQPIWSLQLVHGAAWLGQALLAGWIARLLVPHRRVTQLVAVALTLTATSDYLTNNLTALGYNVAVLAFLLALACGIRFLQSGGIRWCIGSAAALAWSLWTIDVGIPAIPAALLLFGWAAWKNCEPSRLRLVALVLGWAAIVTPVAVIEWRLLHDPNSYSARAFLPISGSALAKRALQSWLENFAPWRWAFARPVWYVQPTVLIPHWVMAAGAALAALVFGFRVQRSRLEAKSRPWPELGFATLFAGMALVSNWVYAGLTMADIHYRTHVLSRVWASLGIGILSGWAAARWPRARAVALAVPILFVGLGTWGGLERQDFFLATWRQHQRELFSIVTAAPGLKPGTSIILRSAATPGRYLATAADYLASSWLVLLYREPDIHSLRLAPDRGTGCRPTPAGLECWHESQADCVANHTCKPDHFDYDRLVLMDFDPSLGVYRLRRTLVGDPLAAGAAVAAGAYRPEARIVHGDLSRDQRRLLLQ